MKLLDVDLSSDLTFLPLKLVAYEFEDNIKFTSKIAMNAMTGCLHFSITNSLQGTDLDLQPPIQLGSVL